jgi:DDE_Tnp_1-associated
MDQGKTINDFFSGITEPRDSNLRHKLIDIITIALCAVMCGADTFDEIEEFGHGLRGFLNSLTASPLMTPLPVSLPVAIPRNFRKPSLDG